MNHAAPSSRRRRVLHGITHLGLGGAERVAFTLLRSQHAQWDCGFFAANGVEDNPVGRALSAELATLSVPLYCGSKLSLKHGGLLIAGLRFAAAVRRFQPDVVHLHTEIPEAAWAVRCCLPFGGHGERLVRTIHNSVYWHYWPRLGRWCERRMRASQVAAVSRDALDAYERFRAGSGAGPLPAPPRIIYNGVPLPAPRPSPPRAADGVRILVAGRFERQKGTDLLPEILRRCRLPAGLRGELVLHGSGHHAPLLHALAATPPPGWSVQVHGPIPDLAAVMPEFDLLLVPSRFEGLGLVAIEAALQHLTVVATDAPGLREALPSDHPWRAPPGEADRLAAALQQALAERSRWPAVAARAREFARERFDVAKMAAAYEALYQQALGC